MTIRSTDSFADIVRHTLAAGVTFRRYGARGELKRPMIHRFPAKRLKCEGSVASVLVGEAMSSTNVILRRLKRSGRDVNAIVFETTLPHSSEVNFPCPK